MPFPDPCRCFAVTAPGVELLLAAELRALGIAPGGTEPGGAEFPATPAQLADALLQLRTANRVTVRLASFHARSFGELERHAGQVTWEDILAPGGAVHFRVTSKKSRLYHQDAIAERLERAALARVPGVAAVRAPSVAETMEADVSRVPAVQRVVVRVLRDQVTLSADAAGALLHVRGWRQAVAKAPMRETLAAALLLASGWDGVSPLLDPLCGSGTIAIEAALIARRMAPGRSRRFAVEGWPGIAGHVMTAARDRATALERPSMAAISGCDRDAGAIAAATANAERAGVGADITFARAAISSLSADSGHGWLVTNPPYGERIGEGSGLRDLYAVLGRVLRERRPRWRLAMLSADRRLEAQVGIPFETVLRTTNGGISVRLVRSKK